MPNKKKSKKTKRKNSKISIIRPAKTVTVGRRTIRFIADRVIIFRLMRRLHGRFWGLTGLTMLLAGLVVCCLIRPDMAKWSTAYSDFGRDVRTAPYLAASLFFGAYGLWRWRNYLKRTLKRSKPVTSLVGLTVTGMYIAALFPVAWEPWPYRIHIFGVILSGTTMAATVVVDTLLTRTRRNSNALFWQLLRLISFSMIMIGGYITLASTGFVGWMNIALLGELIMFFGYYIWVADKTYRGEGSRSQLSKILHKLVLVD